MGRPCRPGRALVWLNGAALSRTSSPGLRTVSNRSGSWPPCPAFCSTYPPGSVVIVSVPASLRERWFWAWSFPFALKPPFQREDLYGQYRIIERPDVYCCPSISGGRRSGRH